MDNQSNAAQKGEILIRLCELGDAAALMELTECLARETQHMLLEPGESKLTVKEQRNMIERTRQSEHEPFFVAVDQAEVVGFIAAHRRSFRRVHHRFHLVLGVRRSHWRKGIGRRFLETAQAWALSAGARRLELTVSAENDRAIQLYQRFGFQVEGIRKNSLFINGEYKDEWYMAKRLAESTT